jgi:tellurite methyltransferase
VSSAKKRRDRLHWADYYRATVRRTPRDFLVRALTHIESHGKSRRARAAVEIGFGAGNETLELLRRGWQVVAIDQEAAASEFLSKRVPSRYRESLTLLTSPMEGLSLPRADLVIAGYSLPFCAPDAFARVWNTIRRSLAPGGHFAGQLFGDRDEWHRNRSMTFQSNREARSLTKGYRVEFFQETEEDGPMVDGEKHWHVFDLILEKPRSR